MFPADVINEISKYSDNQSISNFLSINKDMWGKKTRIYFYGQVDMAEGKNPPINQLKSIIAYDENQIPPLGVVSKLVYGGCGRDVEKITKTLPPSITHLIFGYMFDQSLSGIIPKSVTHLTFIGSFNKPIAEGDIPESVTHLTFGAHFDQPITGMIPKSVKHLNFGMFFNQPIKNGDIPNSVTHLSLGWFFEHDIKEIIPESVVELELGGNFVLHKYNPNQSPIPIPKNVRILMAENDTVMISPGEEIFVIKRKKRSKLFENFAY